MCIRDSHQGHVIDFAMGNLQAATRPAPKQLSKKEAAAAAAAAGATIAIGSEAGATQDVESADSVEGAGESSEEEVLVSEEAPAAPVAEIAEVANGTVSTSGEIATAEPLPETAKE